MDDAKGINYVAKARFIILGFEDPDVLEFETSSPTPRNFTINIFLPVRAWVTR